MQKKALERRGSRQKEVVQNSIVGLCSHPTAEEVYFKAKQEHSSLSLSTVYRNLRILVEEGTLIAISGSGSELHYDSNLSNHCHVSCRVCGKLRDICFPAVNLSELKEIDSSGFSIDGVCVTFTGICNECSFTTGKKGDNSEH